MNARPRRLRRPRRITTIVLGTVAPLMLVAGVTGMGHRAEAAGMNTQHRGALVAVNPVQCVLENAQCAKDAASGNNPCDLIPC